MITTTHLNPALAELHKDRQVLKGTLKDIDQAIRSLERLTGAPRPAGRSNPRRKPATFTEVPAHLAELPVADRILYVMDNHSDPAKSWSTKELARETHVGAIDTVRTTLGRLVDRGKLNRVEEGVWQRASSTPPQA